MIQAASPRSRRTDAMLSSVSSRARHRYEQHRAISGPRYFSQLYPQLTEERFAQQQRPPVDLGGELNREIEEGTAALRQDGVYVWRGLFQNAEWLQRAAAEMQRITEQWEREFATGEPAPPSVGDPQQGPVLLKGNRAQNGQLRATYHSAQVTPEPFRQVMQHPALKEVVCRYFDAESACNYLLAERLTPSDRGDYWHVDRIVDQVKMMVLLTDVEEQQGPLRLKVGTHRHRPELKAVYYNVFTHGVDYAYPPGPLVEKLPGELVLGTGRAGDCIVFDTLAVHSGTACQAGQRDVLVGTWFGATRRTAKLMELSNNRWI